MKLHTHSLRVLHKWIGLVIGIQFILWTLSGLAMAILPMDEVAGGKRPTPMDVEARDSDSWPNVQRQLGNTPVSAVRLRPLLEREVFEVMTPEGIALFETASGERVEIDSDMALKIANANYTGEAAFERITALQELTLPVREHELPIWRVDYADEKKSTFYVSASTGALLERRNDTWRVWDFFWMLHNMDYVSRTSFNHPLIIIVGFAAVWLATTGLWLLFRTGWRSDFKRLLQARRSR